MQYSNIGREVIWTDVLEITDDNVISVLQDAFDDFSRVARRCNFLIEYESGKQPIIRKEEKKFRPDIDVQAVDNVANEITEFKTSFNWCPITLVQRGEKDSGKADEPDAIALLNECYSVEEWARKNRELGHFVEICGVGYTIVDINTEYEEGDSYFHVNVLDPRTSFVVRSNLYPDHRIMMGVTFRVNRHGTKYFTCFTRDRRFEIENFDKITNGVEKNESTWRQSSRSGEINPLGRIPMTEWIRDYDRMGCFERQLSALDNLNLLLSDFSNSVEQNVQSVWWTNDVEFPKDENGDETKPQNGEWLGTFTSQDGRSPSIQPLQLDYNYDGMTTHYIYQRALILEKCNVPNRDSDMSNSTGLAASFAGGYAGAESQANKQTDIMYGCKMDELKSVLAAIRQSPFVPVGSPLLDLKYTDIQPKITRQRSYELTVKVNALATMLNSGVYGEQAFKTVDVFEDSNQAWNDSKDMVTKIQESMISKSTESTTQDTTQNADRVADQISNSPLIDGMVTKDDGVSES